MNKLYSEIISVAGKSFNLTQERIEKLKRNKIVQILCSIPFEAKSQYPDIYALKTIINYIATLQQPIRDFTRNHVNQEIDRLDFIIETKEADEAILNKFKVMLRAGDFIDALRDQKRDKASGRSNPFDNYNFIQKIQTLFNLVVNTLKIIFKKQPVKAIGYLFLCFLPILLISATGPWWL